MIQNQDFNSLDVSAAGLKTLARDAAKLGFSIVDIAAFLADVDKKSKAQQTTIDALSSQAAGVLSSNQTMIQSLETVLENVLTNAESAQSTAELVTNSATQSREVADWVKGLVVRMEEMSDALKHVHKSNQQIASIAAQVNILAVNAKIEAARAGDSGRGFAVVAEAINELSGKTAQAAQDISNDVTVLTDTVTDLSETSNQVAEKADNILTESDAITQATQSLADRANKNAHNTTAIKTEAEQMGALVGSFLPEFEGLGDSITETATGVHHVSQKANGLIDLSETIVQQSVELGGETEDQKFIARVKKDAARIGDLFEQAIQREKITMEALFSKTYRVIEGTDPQQLNAEFTALADRLLPSVQEAALDLDPKVVFCAAVDRRGYLPTHNKKFSHPQGRDPAWNMANCRNRRIFDDRVGLKAGQSTAPFLLQTYRRDMGGGEFAMMKDLSAPIMVQGRHWGGLRLAYLAET